MRRTILTIFLLTLLVHRPAHAYIDPGTGSLILQGIIAAFVGAVFTLKTFFREKVKPVIDWVLRRPKVPAEDVDGAPSDAGADPHKK